MPSGRSRGRRPSGGPRTSPTRPAARGELRGRRGEVGVQLEEVVDQGLDAGGKQRPLLILTIGTGGEDNLIDMPVDALTQRAPLRIGRHRDGELALRPRLTDPQAEEP